MPQKSEGDCKWVLATGGIKENFTEFFSMIKYEDELRSDCLSEILAGDCAK